MISVTRQKEVLVFTKTFFFVESKCSRFQYGAVIPDTVMYSFKFCDIPATFRPRSLHDVMFCHHRSHLADFSLCKLELYCLYLILVWLKLSCKLNCLGWAFFSIWFTMNWGRMNSGFYYGILWYTLQSNKPQVVMASTCCHYSYIYMGANPRLALTLLRSNTKRFNFSS